MKPLRANRPVTLLQLSSPLFMSFLLFNFSSVAMAKEQPKTVKAEKKTTKAQSPIVLNTMEVTEKSDQKLAAASAEVALSPGGVSVVDINGLHDRNLSSVADFFVMCPVFGRLAKAVMTKRLFPVVVRIWMPTTLPVVALSYCKTACRSRPLTATTTIA